MGVMQSLQVCHAPHLLLEHPQLLARQAQHVHRIARQVPHWDRQLQKLSPAQTADLLCRSAPTYARLHYLVQTNQVRQLHSTDTDALQPPSTLFHTETKRVHGLSAL